jgi:hypothetical protein
MPIRTNSYCGMIKMGGSSGVSKRRRTITLSAGGVHRSDGSLFILTVQLIFRSGA